MHIVGIIFREDDVVIKHETMLQRAADLMRNAREAETKLLGMWMAWDGFGPMDGDPAVPFLRSAA